MDISCAFPPGPAVVSESGLFTRDDVERVVAAGAHAVLGSHPHVLQNVVRPTPRALVAWSLGNFVFAPHSPGTERTGILHLDLARDGVRAHRLQRARIVGVQPRLVG